MQDVLKPFLLSLESKSPKLANISLASIQKLVANDAITEEHLLTVVKALEQVSLHAFLRSWWQPAPHNDCWQLMLAKSCLTAGSCKQTALTSEFWQGRQLSLLVAGAVGSQRKLVICRPPPPGACRLCNDFFC